MKISKRPWTWTTIWIPSSSGTPSSSTDPSLDANSKQPKPDSRRLNFSSKSCVCGIHQNGPATAQRVITLVSSPETGVVGTNTSLGPTRLLTVANGTLYWVIEHLCHRRPNDKPVGHLPWRTFGVGNSEIYRQLGRLRSLESEALAKQIKNTKERVSEEASNHSTLIESMEINGLETLKKTDKDQFEKLSTELFGFFVVFTFFF
ncbi:hypothetical protein B9Z55_027612 [Caenorhabditis nigoni]|uniref:Uncharacterized protein n=1 Tax=Caenorhabditis nigoni TaxID=1611254 RepID=A0A2G5SFF9_9PELO|nr:hypothetical protein B9Z55_027612 [Caenorhabditis nigoni]